MAEPRLLFMDVGGVLLTNGWDTEARSRAATHFELDGDELEERHGAVSEAFETGRLELADYLDHVIFHRPRSFDRNTFRRFMESQSHAYDDALTLVEHVERASGLTLVTLNNESLALNRYRIETFGLRPLFTAFFSSCFLGVRKPDPAIFRLAVRVMQEDPGRCFFVDDRPENVAAARATGLQVVHYRGVDPLRKELEDRGIEMRME